MEYFRFSALQASCAPHFRVVLFLPPATFNAGSPSEYALNDVSEKYKQDERVWIIREEEGIYVLFAKCTHLGCTPRWLAAEDKFKCPCHGSGFYSIDREWTSKVRRRGRWISLRSR